MSLLPPEILLQVCRLLEPTAIFFCTSVCRKWREVFTPCLWQVVDAREQPWKTIFRSAPTVDIASLFLQHRQSIRDLAMCDTNILDVALAANLVNLHSMTLHTTAARGMAEMASCQTSITLQSTTSLSALLLECKEMVPRAILSQTNDNAKLKRSQDLWRLILNNTGLHRLAILSSSGLQPFATTTEAVLFPPFQINVLIPASESFIINTVAPLTSLRHLSIGMGADDFLLCNLSTLLPNLESFIHTGPVHFDPVYLSTSSHINLRSLAFIEGVIIAHRLRAIVKAFPGLREISARAYYYDATIDAEEWEYFDHFSLQKITPLFTNGLYGMWKARVRFPKVKSAVFTGSARLTLLPVVVASWVFPELDRLEAQNIVWEMDHVELEIGFTEHRYPTTELVLSGRDNFLVDKLILWFPFLVRLELGTIGGRVLSEIARICTFLVYTRFDLRGQCSIELCWVLASCSRLKECLGDGHVVTAEDIIRGPEWACLGLEKLDIDIRATPENSGRSDFQPLNWIRHVGRCFLLKPRETNLSTQQEISNSIQRQFFAKLSRLRNLQEIGFGPRHMVDPRTWSDKKTARLYMDLLRHNISNSLNFSQNSGLYLLVESLPNLRKIELRRICESRAVGDSQQAWMLRRWMLNITWQDPIYSVVAYRLS